MFFIQQFITDISLESYFEIDHCVSKLLSVEVFNNISKLQSNITMKWPADNQNIHVSKEKSNSPIVFVYAI